MAYAKIPEKEAMSLIRVLGLLVNQAGVYGASHNVTRLTLRSVFTEVEKVVKTYGWVEIALKDAQVLVNGYSDGLDVSTGKNLSDRMRLHKIGGLLFQAPLELGEFSECITLFGTAPQALAEAGGFEAALKKLGLRNVRVVTSVYQRVLANVPQPPVSEPVPPQSSPDVPAPLPVYGPVPPQPAPDASPRPPASGQVLSQPDSDATQRRAARRPGTGSVVLDLSAAFSGSEWAEEQVSREARQPDGAVRSQQGSERQEQVSSLASLLRETATLLEGGKATASSVVTNQAVLTALEKVRGLMTRMTVGSETRITDLASELDEDSLTIASIEAAARRRGIGLKLTRGDLIKRYAELNQEIVQPLTVSTGVIGMLSSGLAGTLTESQNDLLKMANESVQRVNQLVAYMNRISGLPETFTPDAGLIADSYR